MSDEETVAPIDRANIPQFINPVQTIWHLDGDDLHVERVQDVEPVLDLAKLYQDTGNPTCGGDMTFVGILPTVLVERYCNDHGVSFAEFMRNDVHLARIMNDPEYKKLRGAWGGTI